MEAKYTITVTNEELNVIKESLTAGRTVFRKLISTCERDSEAEDICLDKLITSLKLSQKLDNMISETK